jgi:hypothetical protein
MAAYVQSGSQSHEEVAARIQAVAFGEFVETKAVIRAAQCLQR